MNRITRAAWLAIATGITTGITTDLAGATFHDGGVANCSGCHTMHNSENGMVVNTGGSSAKILINRDASSVCLSCHSGIGSGSSPNVSSPDGSAMTPGGDFYWLQKTFSWFGGTSPGERHGHNVVALDFGFLPDPSNVTAPGGTYPASSLSCISCHDPHGRSAQGSGAPTSGSGSYGATASTGTTLGNYRLLGGMGYNAATNSGSYTFSNAAPVAVQNPLTAYGETDSSHVDYGMNMSEWCANCHAEILDREHRDDSHNFRHPIGNDEDLKDYEDSYNQYVSTGDLSGSTANAYLALVPFERGTTNVTALDPTSTTGPNANSRIMCLTCHRAHASAFAYAGRFDFKSPLISDSHPKMGDSGVLGNDVNYAWYGRNMTAVFGAEQRILCEKCHVVPMNDYPAW